MKGDPEERAVLIGRYLAQTNATVRAAAQVFGVSKSTVWKDQCRLRRLEPGLWREVRAVLLRNKAQRHLRGGEATRCKYLREAERAGRKPAARQRKKKAAGTCAGRGTTI